MKTPIISMVVMLLLFSSFALACPPLLYNRNRVSDDDLERFKTIINQIPEDYFKGIEVITIRNRNHNIYNFLGYFSFKSYRTYITIFQFNNQTNQEVCETLLHELGHDKEYFLLSRYLSVLEISKKGLSEDYAEEFRMEYNYLCENG